MTLFSNPSKGEAVPDQDELSGAGPYTQGWPASHLLPLLRSKAAGFFLWKTKRLTRSEPKSGRVLF
jgi:hypothetical protein